MESSSQNPDSKVYCQIRKERVAALPEEIVRQEIVRQLIMERGFPAGGIVLEKGLRQMPHLALEGQNIPERRSDIVCFAKGIHPKHDLFPLLLIECKAVKLTPKVINQVVGYNHFLKAYFIAVANQEEVRTGWYDQEKKEYTFINFIPTYQELMKSIQPLSH